MRWTLAEIETFLAVIDAGSISAAAARANLSKSVVSKRISEFELALGAPLFLRHAGRIQPRVAALDLAERLRPALAELKAATEAVGWGGTGLAGRLAITAPMSFGIRHLGPAIAAFARAHPGLEIVLDYDDQITALSPAGFDVAIRVGALADSTLMARKLCEDPRVVVASPGYLAVHGPILAPEDFARHEAISYLNVRLGQVWTFGREVAPPRPGRISANNGEAMRDMAQAGLGLALLPLFIVHDALADGRLLRVLPEVPPLPVPISAVWPPARPMPAKTRAFVDHLATAFGERPPWLG